MNGWQPSIFSGWFGFFRFYSQKSLIGNFIWISAVYNGSTTCHCDYLSICNTLFLNNYQSPNLSSLRHIIDPCQHDNVEWHTVCSEKKCNWHELEILGPIFEYFSILLLKHTKHPNKPAFFQDLISVSYFEDAAYDPYHFFLGGRNRNWGLKGK